MGYEGTEVLRERSQIARYLFANYDCTKEEAEIAANEKSDKVNKIVDDSIRNKSYVYHAADQIAAHNDLDPKDDEETDDDDDDDYE